MELENLNELSTDESSGGGGRKLTKMWLIMLYLPYTQDL
jgi:hypothetical protein